MLHVFLDVFLDQSTSKWHSTELDSKESGGNALKRKHLSELLFGRIKNIRNKNKKSKKHPPPSTQTHTKTSQRIIISFYVHVRQLN